MGVDDLLDHLFAFADHEGIDEGVHRLGVVGGVPAGDHQRVRSSPRSAENSGMPARSRILRVLVYSVS